VKIAVQGWMKTMWSKRRKRFRRHYDYKEHQWLLLKTWIEHRLTEGLIKALDNAILYGFEDEKQHSQENDL
jgi:hypothetical protein